MEMNMKELIVKGFSKAFSIKEKGKFIESNTLRSSKFVYEISVLIFERFKCEIDKELHVITVNDYGEKDQGELLLDFLITQTKEVTERKMLKIPTKAIWAGESEYNTSSIEFVNDFRKLLLIKSRNLIYLNGLDQKTELGRKDYINKRLNTLMEILKDEEVEFSEFYFAFWPSPQKQGENKSIWNAYPFDELKDWIEVYKIEKLNEKYSFTKIQ